MLSEKQPSRPSSQAMDSMPLPRAAQEAILRIQTEQELPLDRFWADPSRIMSEAKLDPDPWQADLLRLRYMRILLLCSRQAGKSQTAAALSLRTALLEPNSLVLLLSPTLRQSGELFRDKVMRLYDALNRPLRATQETALTLQLSNGSRIVSLPGEERTIRGYSGVAMLVIDEAARVDDDLYRSVRPMIAVSGGRLVALSTAYARLGWFFESWQTGTDWHRVRVPASSCPRISAAFLREELEALGPRWFAMEYGCEFQDAVDALFSEEDVRAALDNSIEPLFGE